MSKISFTTTFSVDRSPEDVFAAINDVRSWWSGEIAGKAEKVGDVFTYRADGAHFTRQTVTESAPGRTVRWHVSESRITFVKDRSEWSGTEVVFELERKGDRTEVRFAHLGLSPALECYDACSRGWRLLVKGNLKQRILTGKAQPSPW